MITKIHNLIYRYAIRYVRWFDAQEYLKRDQLKEDAKTQMNEFLKICGPEFTAELEEQDVIGSPFVTQPFGEAKLSGSKLTLEQLRNAKRES